MTPRQNLIDLFSTFAQFADDRFRQWVTDGQLRRSMQRQELHHPSASDPAEPALPETIWALHWYRIWQTQPSRLVEGHLSAYLQETCYWVVQQLLRSQPSRTYPLSDYFQMAIAQLPKVLKGYDSRGASLKTYASLRFKNALRDALRQQQELNRRTDWGVLRKVSQKCLVEALQMAGLSTETIASYCLAWSCYKACHAPNADAQTRQLTAPDAEIWEAIASRYNQQRHLTQVPAASPEQLDRWLKDCAKRIRAYLDPPTTSLNLTRFDDASGELQDDLTDAIDQSPLTLLITQEEVQERKTKSQQINDLLMTALGQLDPQVQSLLKLYYQQGLTQQQIAQQLEMKQYTISRRISSTKEALLKAIAQWSQSTLHISLTSPAVEQMSLVLEEWLQTHYGNLEQNAN